MEHGRGIIWCFRQLKLCSWNEFET